MAKTKEMLLVASKVKAYIKQKKMMSGSESLVALNDEVYTLIDKAIARCKANKRATVAGRDV